MFSNGAWLHFFYRFQVTMLITNQAAIYNISDNNH